MLAKHMKKLLRVLNIFQYYFQSIQINSHNYCHNNTDTNNYPIILLIVNFSLGIKIATKL